ncbi:MAG: pyruvate ferredoxin oxidoreductase, partial [Desulfobacterales bacterium]|nr:pyruvate ferredoxin oxidoreductase [Desulfobacterales bacterium]
KAGLLKLKMFRPFPIDFFRQVLSGKQKVAVVDRNCSFGASGIFAQELRAALYNAESPPRIFGYIAGLGGRDITPQTIEDIYWQTQKENNPQTESIWIGLDQETVESWRN